MPVDSKPVDEAAEPSSTSRRANVVGLGLIGGSICAALSGHGWHVSGDDADDARAALALLLRLVDRGSAA